ncbi:MAG: cation:proton antiporter [Candidatus Rokuibacteriota bacterium]|jgi:Kef-type K+ transport system membrane component KefB
MTPHDLTVKLFLQLAVILAASRACGFIGRRFFGQTQVVSEIVAGVLLGPSLFGLLAPEAQAWLFPKTLPAGGPHPSMLILYALSQVGLVLYMFIIGMEFNHRLLLGRVRHASLVSGAGIAVPLALGAIAALTLRDDADLFAPHVTPGAAALYLGAAMSITAFPTLARILHEKGITRSRLGTLALAAGSSGDAAAWCLLALVLSYLEGSWLIAVLAIGGGGLYVLVMLLVGRRLLRVLDRGVDGQGRIAPGTLVAALLVLMLGAFVTDVVGIYAVFGAFIVGVAMPRGRFAEAAIGNLEPITTTFLLPVFFVYSGLNTQIGLLTSPAIWRVAVILVAVAIVGKGVACLLAARVAGEAWRESVAIGVLMNARGLMELIILNIGLQHGIITPTLFTIMVLMAVITTLMTSPLFDLVYGRRGAAAAHQGQAA